MRMRHSQTLAKKGMTAVSDGAGGGGVFAELWSKYLLSKLPVSALSDFKQLDAWVDGIWEPYYKDCEKKAQQQGALFLNKFYDEGSFATLAAVWLQDSQTAEWMTYGDSVVFCYDFHNHELKYSNIRKQRSTQRRGLPCGAVPVNGRRGDICRHGCPVTLYSDEV